MSHRRAPAAGPIPAATLNHGACGAIFGCMVLSDAPFADNSGEATNAAPSDARDRPDERPLQDAYSRAVTDAVARVAPAVAHVR